MTTYTTNFKGTKLIPLRHRTEAEHNNQRLFMGLHFHNHVKYEIVHLTRTGYQVKIQGQHLGLDFESPKAADAAAKATIEAMNY